MHFFEKHSTYEEGNSYLYQMWNKKTLDKVGNGPQEISIETDGISSYRKNSYGFRSDEFDGTADILVAGCSITYGAGIRNEEDLWYNKVAKALNLKAASIAFPGWSVVQIVDKIFQYFHSYGNPKYLVALFPDFSRMIIPVDNNFYTTSEVRREHLPLGLEHGEEEFYASHYIDHSRRIPKISKLPHEIIDVISHDLLVDQIVREIRRLEAYCKAANINLLWANWSHRENRFLDSLEKETFKFDNYFSLGKKAGWSSRKIISKEANSFYFYSRYKDMLACIDNHENIDCACHIECHEEERKDFVEAIEKEFDIGTDRLFGIERAHPGVHTHIHYANAFLEELKSRQMC